MSSKSGDDSRHATGADDPTPIPTCYCRKCYYALSGLTEPRCPECGQPFDLTDPRAYSREPHPPRRARAILLAYGLALGLTFAFWLLQDSSRWAGMTQRRGWLQLSWFALASACGPVSWWLDHVPQPVMLWLMPVLFAALWSVWLTLACASPLRRLPAFVHFILAMLWCFCGCARVGLVIT